MGTSTGNGFRLSDATIHAWTRFLLATMAVLVALGLGLGLWSDGESAPEWTGEAALVVVITGVVGPLLAAAVLGGESIRRGGGVIGVLLTYGLVAGASGEALEIPWALWSGGLALGAAIIGFWVIGWIAKVPMYVGLPWARGRTIQQTESSDPQIGVDDPRLRVRRPPGAKANEDPRR